MKKSELLRRIEVLEQQVRDLQSRPVVYPPAVPVCPQPEPWPHPSPWEPKIWCSAGPSPYSVTIGEPN